MTGTTLYFGIPVTHGPNCYCEDCDNERLLLEAAQWNPRIYKVSPPSCDTGVSHVISHHRFLPTRKARK